MWSGLIYATLESLNPVMNERIDWRWFIASQFAFGIVAGIVVARHTPVRTLQYHAICRARGVRGGRPGTRAPRGGAEAMTRPRPAANAGLRFAGVYVVALSACAALASWGCGSLPGKPLPESRELRPEEVKDFAVLYRVNCSGCHGPDGKGGAALALANPVYLAIADEETLRRVAVERCRGNLHAGVRASGGGNAH